ncbi:MAG: ACT domain-containing protein [Chlamydiae bacterium]|nr:ACT domain-containing protein [Chlamydiota bacterium]
MLNLSVLPFSLAIVRLNPGSLIPAWAMKGEFFSVTKTSEELSIVCLEKDLPGDIKAEKDWKMFKVEGPLDFSMTGVLSSLALPLAQGKISIFAVSTYDTDDLLVKAKDLDRAVETLSRFCKIRK